MSPYRTMQSRARTLPWSVRWRSWLVRAFLPQWWWPQFRCFRRASGGVWELRVYLLIHGSPECWRRRGDEAGPEHYMIAEEEHYR